MERMRNNKKPDVYSEWRCDELQLRLNLSPMRSTFEYQSKRNKQSDLCISLPSLCSFTSSLIHGVLSLRRFKPYVELCLMFDTRFNRYFLIRCINTKMSYIRFENMVSKDNSINSYLLWMRGYSKHVLLLWEQKNHF